MGATPGPFRPTGRPIEVPAAIHGFRYFFFFARAASLASRAEWNVDIIESKSVNAVDHQPGRRQPRRPVIGFVFAVLH